MATFDDLTLDEAASGYTLTATATGLASATSDAFDVGPGPAAKLVFTVQPSDVDQKTSISPAVVVTVQDAHGNTVTTSTASVTLAITGGTGTAGAVLGGSPVAAVSGVAQFGSLTVDLAGTGYTLTATSLGLNSATSTTFAVRAAGIQNGGFELWPDASWLQHSSSGRALIDVSPPPFAAHGGAYVAWLGGANNESDELTQRLTMPSQGHRLRFWHLITSAEPTGQAGGSGDSVTVQINSVVVGQFDLGRGGPPADHWVSADYDVGVGVRPGQTVVVTFRAKTDASLVSSFLIDDVTIQ